jgi:hypothetical protein
MAICRPHTPFARGGSATPSAIAQVADRTFSGSLRVPNEILCADAQATPPLARMQFEIEVGGLTFSSTGSIPHLEPVSSDRAFVVDCDRLEATSAKVY